ncbi:MAG: hypothetical protein GX823_00455 [Clostridiales bacterium]|nr:hypothetical protein [Clostridiales bacterium]
MGDSSGDIKYTTAAGKPVTFDGDDFIAVGSSRGAGAALDSVQFVLPPPSVGALYEVFVDHNSYAAAVSEDKSYYTAGSGSSSINTVTFLPKAGISGVVAIPYRGTD